MTGLKIGEVLALLRAEHPDLELSKIRYYEDMGLVAPSRTSKGYRMFSERDVACLREAIRLADEEFVPLRVARVRLIEQGLLDDTSPAPAAAPVRRAAARTTAPKVVSLPVPPVARPNLSVVSPPSSPPVTEEPPIVEATSRELTVTELFAAAGVEPEYVNKVLALGLVTPIAHGRDVVYRQADVETVRAAAQLLRHGVDGRALGALRRVVDRQLGIVEDLSRELRASKASPQDVAAAVHGLAEDIESLRRALWQRAVDDLPLN